MLPHKAWFWPLGTDIGNGERLLRNQAKRQSTTQNLPTAFA
jgi:hypothetical protein